MTMYNIEYTEDALVDLQFLRKNEQQLIINEIENQLVYEPTIPTNNRKRLRPNQVAEWELRIDRYRVFYDVIDQFIPETIKIVKIEAVGLKIHNILYIRGKEFPL
jgi:mRNA-degrading endonuclease RelE of RelBE toxin-antitoxin system